MTQINGIKGGGSDEAFQEQCLMCERGASVGLDFDFLNFKVFFMHKNMYKTEGNGEWTSLKLHSTLFPVLSTLA